jgi:hypothetical protein
VSFLPKICDTYMFSRTAVLGGGAGRGEFTRGNVTTHHDELAGNVLDAVEAVVVLAMAESVRVDVGGEVADCGLDAFVEGRAESEVAAETHAGCAL